MFPFFRFPSILNHGSLGLAYTRTSLLLISSAVVSRAEVELSKVQ